MSTESPTQTADAPPTKKGPEKGWSIRRWVLTIVGLLVALWCIAWLWAPLWPLDQYFDETAAGDWLGLVGSLLSAGIGGLVAGLILREQLSRQEKHLGEQIDAQSGLQADALSAQKEEARRGREQEVLSQLVLLLNRRTIADQGVFTEDEDFEFDRLALFWIQNSGLDLDQARDLPLYVRSMFSMISHWRAHHAGRRQEAEGGRLRQTFPSELLDLRVSSAATDHLANEARERVFKLLTLPDMGADAKRSFLDELDLFLKENASSHGMQLDPTLKWPHDDRKRIYER